MDKEMDLSACCSHLRILHYERKRLLRISTSRRGEELRHRLIVNKNQQKYIIQLLMSRRFRLPSRSGRRQAGSQGQGNGISAVIALTAPSPAPVGFNRGISGGLRSSESSHTAVQATESQFSSAGPSGEMRLQRCYANSIPAVVVASYLPLMCAGFVRKIPGFQAASVPVTESQSASAGSSGQNRGTRSQLYNGGNLPAEASLAEPSFAFAEQDQGVSGFPASSVHMTVSRSTSAGPSGENRRVQGCSGNSVATSVVSTPPATSGGHNQGQPRFPASSLTESQPASAGPSGQNQDTRFQNYHGNNITAEASIPQPPVTSADHDQEVSELQASTESQPASAESNGETGFHGYYGSRRTADFFVPSAGPSGQNRDTRFESYRGSNIPVESSVAEPPLTSAEHNQGVSCFQDTSVDADEPRPASAESSGENQETGFQGYSRPTDFIASSADRHQVIPVSPAASSVYVTESQSASAGSSGQNQDGRFESYDGNNTLSEAIAAEPPVLSAGHNQGISGFADSSRNSDPFAAQVSESQSACVGPRRETRYLGYYGNNVYNQTTARFSASLGNNEQLPAEVTQSHMASAGPSREHPQQFPGICPICHGSLNDIPIAATICGHIFCKRCLRRALEFNKICPKCRKISHTAVSLFF